MQATVVDNSGPSLADGAERRPAEPVVPEAIQGPPEAAPAGFDCQVPPRNGAPSLAAALLSVLPLSPFLVGACLMAVYVMPPTGPIMPWLQANLLLVGCAAGLLLSGALAAWYCYVLRGTAADHAHSTAYTNQVQRLLEIEARLSVYGARPGLSETELAAYRRADADRRILRAELALSGLRWVLGVGYMAVWSLVHRAEEALLLLLPVDEVLAAAQYDRLRLEESNLPMRKLLQDQLAEAVTALQRNPTHLDARLAVSQVRTMVNQYRDDSRETLVRSRNHLMGTLLVTGVTAVVLLSVAIVGQHGAATSDLSADPVVAGVVVYLVGALIGLFSRLNRESRADDAVDDYGLTAARLLLTPVLSGLAAVGGVLIIAFLPFLINGDALNPGSPLTPGSALNPANSGVLEQVVTRTIPRLHLIYNLQTNPLGLALAATFGLTPSLLVGALQRTAESAKQALKSTNATTGSTQHK